VALEEEQFKEIKAIDEDLMPGRSFTNGRHEINEDLI
jgi:hypothetical protein